jgi:ABC-type multidrug transport system permease subunit
VAEEMSSSGVISDIFSKDVMFLLIFLSLIVTMADWLGYVNPNIQTRMLVVSTLVTVLTYVAYDLCVIDVYYMCTNALFQFYRIT